MITNERILGIVSNLQRLRKKSISIAIISDQIYKQKVSNFINKKLTISLINFHVLQRKICGIPRIVNCFVNPHILQLRCIEFSTKYKNFPTNIWHFNLPKKRWNVYDKGCIFKQKNTNYYQKSWISNQIRFLVNKEKMCHKKFWIFMPKSRMFHK